METDGQTIMLCSHLGCICWIDEADDILMSMPINSDNTLDWLDESAVEFDNLDNDVAEAFSNVEAKIRKIRAERARELDEEISSA